MSAEAPNRVVWFPALPREAELPLPRDTAPDRFPRVNDADLLTRAQAGDTHAVAALFMRFSRLVLAIGMRILHDRGEAEDLVQEVFLRLCQKANTFDAGKGSARTWMFQFAYRRALDRRGYLMRRSFYADTESSRVTNALEEASRFDEQMTARITAEELHAVFDNLNDKQRATLELFFFENYNLREVAERLGESFENTRNHYYRGLKQLRRAAAALTARGEK